jgi:hypothetical protein
VEAFIEATVEQFPQERQARAREMMTTPEMIDLVTGKLAEQWQSMVPLWSDWDIGPGEKLTGEMDVDGSVTTWEHLGEVDRDGAGPLVHLRVVHEVSAEALRQLQLEVSGALGGPEDPSWIPNASKTMTYEVHLDPIGLRPHMASRANESTMVVDGTPQHSFESARTELFWARAEGCGR